MYEPLSSDEWLRLLHPSQSWRSAYPKVEQEAIRYLDALDPAVTVGTTDLHVALMPRSDDRAAIRRLYQALKACARHGLVLYNSSGEPKDYYGKIGRPLRWHAERTSK